MADTDPRSSAIFKVNLRKNIINRAPNLIEGEGESWREAEEASMVRKRNETKKRDQNRTDKKFTGWSDCELRRNGDAFWVQCFFAKDQFGIRYNIY